MKLHNFRFLLLLTVAGFIAVNFLPLTQAENNTSNEAQLSTERTLTLINSNNKIGLTGIQKAIPDEVAFELFLRTVGENNARQLIENVGFDSERDAEKIDRILHQAKNVSENLENFDKQSKELKMSENGKNFTANSDIKRDLDKLQLNKKNILQRIISRNLQESATQDNGWEKLQNYIRTKVKSQIQVVSTKSSSKHRNKNVKNVAFVKSSFKKSFAQTQADDIYLYSTGWNDGTNAYGSGTISEKYTSGTSYLVSVTVTSPSGRTNTTSSDWSYATLSNNTGLSLGVEDGTYNIQAHFEADAGGYYDEWGNYHSYGTYSIGNSNGSEGVPPRITLLPISMSRPRILPANGETSNAEAIVTYSNTVPANTRLAIELIDAITNGNPSYTIDSTIYNPAAGGTANTPKTGTLTVPENTSTTPRQVTVNFPFRVINGSGGNPGTGTVNVNIIIAGVVTPPTPTPNPGTTPQPAPTLVNPSQFTNLTIATPTPTPSPTPNPNQTGGGCGACGFAGLGCAGCAVYGAPGTYNRCPPPFFNHLGCCCQGSPIVIDVDGDGFAMTNGNNGVSFDLGGDGMLERTSWTATNSDDAWLVLDRNNNNRIDDGKELFGNYCDQPPPPAGVLRNGFIGLAEFDKAANGGNNDGKITRTDNVFRKLRLWQDKNHNGISEPEELSKLPALDVVALFLDYQESRRTDEHGNRFKYRARVRDRNGVRVGRWAWDVFTVPGQN